MAIRSHLTLEQRRAAAANEPRVYVEAGPGSGKTTVAAERFGIHRFTTPTANDRAVLALSFTRSAVNELTNRVTSRWGSTALSWPHQAATLDALHVELLTYLLRMGSLSWPRNHTDLTVLDDWRGQPGARDIYPGYYQRVVYLRGRVVDQRREQVSGRLIRGFSTTAAFSQHLNAGRCTHREVRQIIYGALMNFELRAQIVEYLGTTRRAAIVDEIFDANDLDLSLVRLMCEAGLRVTLIGDPWQALYVFRDARPDLVEPFLETSGFVSYPVTRSFRFQTASLDHQAYTLRAGSGVEIPDGVVESVDVILAAKWKSLWKTPPNVLPLSFGTIDTQTCALMTLLLDQVVSARFQRSAVYTQDALAALGIEPTTYQSNARLVFLPVLEQLRSGSEDAAGCALKMLRDAGKDLGCRRRPTTLGKAREDVQISRLRLLSQRLKRDHLIPGMTVHQAKGREWDRVGVLLTPSQKARVRRGLDKGNSDDRVLYVALTRARHNTIAV